ncbi:hypothetical protein BDV95DRAFT_635984 [Massariosphaeria phaeospora]|uniref:Uncharacterized protein n=1 Tax=Massariosphaeria phaeospora TaxID=100035 RepID=A0A7C8IAE8_9PLEO|nr:hypothetical protein BDV95DRAFT_635984 [Massariosphaeria phaeospora]
MNFAVGTLLGARPHWEALAGTLLAVTSDRGVIVRSNETTSAPPATASLMRAQASVERPSIAAVAGNSRCQTRSSAVRARDEAAVRTVACPSSFVRPKSWGPHGASLVGNWVGQRPNARRWSQRGSKQHQKSINQAAAHANWAAAKTPACRPSAAATTTPQCVPISCMAAGTMASLHGG